MTSRPTFADLMMAHMIYNFRTVVGLLVMVTAPIWVPKMLYGMAKEKIARICK
jgi:hypothetical protein